MKVRNLYILFRFNVAVVLWVEKKKKGILDTELSTCTSQVNRFEIFHLPVEVRRNWR